MLSRACFLCFLVSLITIGFGVAFFPRLFFDFVGISKENFVFADGCQAYSVDGKIRVRPEVAMSGREFSGTLNRLGHLHLMLLADADLDRCCSLLKPGLTIISCGLLTAVCVL
jgi:hypothetical protein